MTAGNDALATVFTDLAAIGRKLVETSKSALALLEAREAECRPSPPETAAQSMPTISQPEPMLLTRREVADLLRVGERTLSRWLADPRGKFPKPIRRGRVLRWRRGEVERWLEGRRTR